jgi:hypothetical protein
MNKKCLQVKGSTDLVGVGLESLNRNYSNGNKPRKCQSVDAEPEW